MAYIWVDIFSSLHGLLLFSSVQMWTVVGVWTPSDCWTVHGTGVEHEQIHQNCEHRKHEINQELSKITK